MKRWFVRTLILALILIGIGLISANSLLDRYVASNLPIIEQRLSAAIGATVKLVGLKAQLFPYPSIHAHQGALSWPESQRAPLDFQELTIRIRLLPLLSGNLEASHIATMLPEIALDKSGKGTLKDTNISGKLRVEGGTVIVNNFSITTRLNAMPLTLTSPRAFYDKKTIEIDSLELKSKVSHLTLDSLVNLESGTYRISSNDFILAKELAAELGRLITAATSVRTEIGEARGKIVLSGNNFDSLQLTGHLKVEKLKRSSGFSVGAIALQDLNLTWDKGGSLKVLSALNGQVLEFVDQKTSYQSRSIKGKIDYQKHPQKGMTVAGKVEVDQFSYDDGTTRVYDVVATIDPLQVSTAPSGDMNMVFPLSGSSLKLDHSAVQVSGAKSVRSVLKVNIPAKGGYQVSGPVTVEEGNVRTLNQDLNRINGTIQMVIAPKEQSYIGKGIKFINLGKDSQLSADFRILPQEFTLRSAESDNFGGALALNAQMARSGERPFKIAIKGRALSFQRLRDFIITTGPGVAIGTVEDAQFQVAGNYNTFAQSLTGNGAFRISQDSGDKTILARLLFRALSAVPIVNGILTSSKELDDLQVVEAQVSFKDAACVFDAAKLTRASYTVNARGKITFDKQLDLKGDVVFLESTLSSLGLGIGPLKQLLSRAGRIVVPIFITGTLPNVSIEADIKTFLKNNSGFTLGTDILQGIGSVFLPAKSTPPPESTGTPEPSRKRLLR